MSSTSSQSNMPAPEALDTRPPQMWRGVLIGFLPLLSLAVIAAAAVAVTAGVRAVISGQSFSTEQFATILTLGGGLALGGIVYSIALARVWRRMTAWRRKGYTTQAAGALWALAITALIVVLPVVLALVIPQHPAP